MIRRWQAMLALLVLVSPLLLACADGVSEFMPWLDTPLPDSGCAIRIGIIYAKESGDTSAGSEQWHGYELALEEINAGGGLLGCTVELVERDEGTEGYRAQEVVKELVEDEGVLVISGASSSDQTVPAVGVTDVMAVPFIVPSASTDLITTQGYEWVFRIIASSKDYAEATLEFFQRNQQKLGIPVGRAPTVAIVYEDSLWGESGAVAVARGATEREFRLVAYEAFATGLSDYRRLLLRVKHANPDAVWFVAKREAPILMQQCEQVDLNPKLYLGLAGWFTQPRFIDVAGPYAEYVISTAQWATDVREETWPGVAELVQRFGVKYEGALPGTRSVQTYVALYLIVDAIGRAAEGDPEAEDAIKRLAELAASGSKDVDWTLQGTDLYKARLAIREALARTEWDLSEDASSLHQTVFGPIKFDPQGQNAHQVILTQIINGEFVTVYPGAFMLDEYKDLLPAIPVPHWDARPPLEGPED